jgi:hypothetical protein
VRLRVRRGESARVQRGFALIALLSLAALFAAFLIATALNFTSAGISNEREDRSMNALRQAKAALIAYAASEQWQLYKGEVTTQPGALPCPDILHDGTENEEGDSDCVLPLTSSLIGRLPFKTLGINDLRDASGEQLWYALSANFRKASGTTVINSDTQPCDTPVCNPSEIHLTVTGTAPASNVVAVLFAPGEAILGQTRSSNPTDPAHNNPANYLENFSLNVDGIHFTFTTAQRSDTFNDRVLVITQADLMAAVEPVVAARIERDVKPLLIDYFNKWGRYPFAVPFASPPVLQSAYLGVSNQTTGLLPLTNTATFTWQNPTVTQIPPGDGTPIVTSAPCSISSLTVTCTVNYQTGGGDRPDIKLEVFLTNTGLAFADKPSPFPAPENLAMLDGNGDTASNQGSPYGPWSKLGSPPRVPTVTFVPQGSGAVLTYTGRLQNASDMNHQAKITVPLPAPGYLPRLTNPISTNPNIAWFLSNQWYRQTFFAVSPDYLPGGGGDCISNPPCLTVKNLSAPVTNGQAILILAGRSLNGTARPSANPKDYLEGENCNLTVGKDLDVGPSTCTFWTTSSPKPNDNVYEHRAGVPTTINDRVVVVSPP